MQYTFLTNVFQWQRVGGPQTAARNIEAMLQRHAEFPFSIIKTQHKQFLDSVSENEIIHIQSNKDLVSRAIKRNLPLIVGPNMIWQQATKDIWAYENMKAVLTLRPDPAVQNKQAVWGDRISFFPPFIDEKFWIPQDKIKSIDVLTIGKSFPYADFYKNHIMLEQGIRKHKLKHLHLQKFSQQELKNALSRSKVIAYPSPRESGASCCHILLEANMMNVPFIGLTSVIRDQNDEYNSCRGIAVENIADMIDQLPSFVKKFRDFQPRKWVTKRHSFKAAYERLSNLIERLKLQEPLPQGEGIAQATQECDEHKAP